MTSSFRNRRGSALLIVLGMLSFMLFSGLAFSVYMRYSRLPTSFLRRTSTTRQLTKAALAEAIDDIDRAIGNDPHPGIPSGLRASGLQNIWSHRVFIGEGSTGGSSGSGGQAETDSSGRYTPSFASAADTVPTLTLEGLAYLPPNLINEARYYSQLTPTAKWHSFWFDSGRYAYTAIDVSDYFDVNRIQANRPRASCPSRRISFAHLFEEGADHSSAGSGAAQWDSFMKKYREVNDETCEFTFRDYPFVSMADFNIAWGSQAIGGLKCPFYNFVKGTKPYDCGESADDPDAEKYRCMTFVTDGWYPTPKKTGNIEVADLESKQPFNTSELEGASSSYNLDHVMESGDDLFNNENYFAGRVCGLTRVALWDYLDEDKCPLSLALPTCEQVPMICGIQPEFAGMKFTVKTDPSPVSANDAESRRDNQYVWYKRIVKYYMVLDALGGDLNGKIAWAYPFLLKGQEAKTLGSDDKFNLDGKVAIYLTDAEGGGISARPNNAMQGLFLKDKNDLTTGDVVNETVVTYPFSAVGLSNVNPQDIFKTCGQSVKGAIQNKSGGYGVPVQDVRFKCDASKNSAASSSSGKLMVTVTYEWRKKRLDKEGNETTLYAEPEQDPEIANHTTLEVPSSDGFGLLANNGKKDTNFDFIKNASVTRKVKVNVAVWARVTDAQKNKAFDLVPACLKDDKLNSLDNTGMGNKFGDDSPAYPLLAFEAGEMEFSLAKFNAKDLGEFSVSGQALVTGDPRYNHAPENWNRISGFSEESLSMYWYSRESADAGAKDGDVYMATSDQARMQSVYELMMLPRLQNALTRENSMGFTGTYPVNCDGKVRGAGETLKDRAFMWRTYNMGDFDELGDGRIVSGGNGMKVNPYSDSKKVMMAAFANTPYNWRLASDEDDDLYNMEASKFNVAYAWNDYDSKRAGQGPAKICWEHLENLAGAFQEDVRDQSLLSEYENYAKNLKSGNGMVPEHWSYVFQRLGWSSDSRYLLSDLPQLEEGKDTDLFAVDKKFLYGFWHDCFAARQQLFLIFVRAEPMMMGGGVKGQVPPQLGARAVALVWRDPAATTGTRTVGGQTLPNPHRTRILFYHQFD